MRHVVVRSPSQVQPSLASRFFERSTYFCLNVSFVSHFSLRTLGPLIVGARLSFFWPSRFARLDGP